MSAIDISSYIALLAMALLTANILLGLLISVRYSTLRSWPHRQINIFALHNWTGYTALCVAGLHPIVLLFSKTAGFRWLDLLWPIHSPSQPRINSLGAAAFYCLAVVVITSYFRLQLGRKLWKGLHYTAYLAAAMFFLHGILTDPELKNRPTDFLDGEKVFIEGCLLVVLAAVAWRVRYSFKKRAVHEGDSGPPCTQLVSSCHGADAAAYRQILHSASKHGDRRIGNADWPYGPKARVEHRS